MKYAILTSLFVAAATLSPAALAAEPTATLRIDLTGIDLATPRGAEAVERRIDRAVAAFLPQRCRASELRRPPRRARVP